MNCREVILPRDFRGRLQQGRQGYSNHKRTDFQPITTGRRFHTASRRERENTFERQKKGDGVLWRSYLLQKWHQHWIVVRQNDHDSLSWGLTRPVNVRGHGTAGETEAKREDVVVCQPGKTGEH